MIYKMLMNRSHQSLTSFKCMRKVSYVKVVTCQTTRYRASSSVLRMEHLTEINQKILKNHSRVSVIRLLTFRKRIKI